MRRFLGVLLAALIVVSIVGCVAWKHEKIDGGPQIAAGIKAKLDKSGSVNLSGSNFPEGKEVCLLLTTEDGVQSNIGYALNPQPVADKGGSWSSTWSYGRFVKKKLVKEGRYEIVAVDEDYNTIAQETITFTVE